MLACLSFPTFEGLGDCGGLVAVGQEGGEPLRGIADSAKTSAEAAQSGDIAGKLPSLRLVLGI